MQSVTASSGYAYGTIGADIHVFGDGTPLYLLLNWQVPPEADREWLLELPSRMLNARFAVVDFTGRDSELAELWRWRDTGLRLAARWMHAPGGQGKTRLAAWFAQQSADAGWKVITAIHGPGSVLPQPGSQDMSLAGAAGILLIVDYGDRWPLTHLTWLFSNALLHQAGVATRVLLLARTDDAWPAIRGTLADQQAGTSSQFLDPLPEEPERRCQMFDVARDGFAARYGIPHPWDIGPPGPLGNPDMGLTLAVHMAALVAVDARSTGRRAPSTMAGLTVYLLDREHLHWARLYGDGAHQLNPAEKVFRTPPAVMNQAVFTATLTGPVSREAGTAILRAAQVSREPSQLLTDHAMCYPPSDPERVTFLEPLYPDRLAEDFLALTMPGHTDAPMSVKAL